MILTDEILAHARRRDLVAVQTVVDNAPDLVSAVLAGHGRTLLWEAVRYGHTDLVEFLLAQGAAVNAPGRHRAESLVMLTPLGVARSRGRGDLVALLEANGAKLDIYNAAFLGDLHWVQQCVEATPDLVNRLLPEDTTWNTIPLHFAASGVQVAVAQFLCACGSDAAQHGQLLLDIATRRGSRVLVEQFLECGADARELTAFSVLVGGKSAELLPLLIDPGLNINGDKFGYPALIYASRGDKGEHPDWILELLKYGLT